MHMRAIVNRAYRKLGFILRSCKYFKNIKTLKLLYCALVRPHVEYAAIVWSPYQVNHSLMIERVQHRFIRRISFLVGEPMKYSDHSYGDLQGRLGLVSLQNRREILDLTFLFRLIGGQIYCAELLAKVKLHIPSRPLRNKQLFHEEYHRTSYGRHKPLNRICIQANKSVDLVDFFHGSIDSFKRSLLMRLYLLNM